jgi:ABC-type antimicrobial peptide transport system permease subunit
MTIVGVSANTSFRSPGEEPTPLLQSLNAITPSFVVRTTGMAATALPEVSRVIESAAPTALSGSFATAQRLDHATFPTRAATVLLSVVATVGLLMALIGLSGITVYNVTRRTPEIGIRMALGATAGQVVRLAMHESLRPVAVGAAIGMAGALGLTRFVAAFLARGVRPSDPLAFGAVLATLFATAGISVWLPSRRAAKIDPFTTLRGD